MERATFFERYQICNEYNGSRAELGRFGPAIIYKAIDLRSGAPVALTLLPIASVDPAACDRFEEQARAAEKLDHVNIGKTFAFGSVGDQFAFASEYPQGETVEQWIGAHGPMPADAVLRVALQVVSALAAASFVGLTHPAIQPSNLMIVSGRTAEGGWPYVKLMDFALAGLKLAPDQPEQQAMTSEFASPEQLERGTADFRSEIYSLGATMCFLLTGAFYAAEPRSLQTRRFAGPLRRLIAPMLRQNPDERPQDAVLFAQALRSCLQKVERRQALARTLGLSFVATKPIKPRHPPHRPPVPLVEPDVIGAPPVAVVPASPSTINEPTARPRLWPRVLALAAILLVLATAIALFVPAPISMILHRNRDKEAIGVPIGVPDSSAVAAAQNNSSDTASMPSASAFQSPGSAAPSASPIANKNNIVANNSQTTAPVQSAAPPQPASSTAIASANESGTTNQAAAEPMAPTSEAAPATTPSVSQQTQLAAADPATSTNGADTPRASATQSPAPPAEEPETVWQRESQAKEKTVAQNSDQTDNGSASESKPAAKKTTKGSSDVSSRSRSKSRDVASNTSRMRPPRYESSRTARIPWDDRDQFQPPYQPYQQDEPRARRALPVPEGSFRARVVGTTPEGNLILRLPSGEIAIVPPRHRPRRVWIERSPYFEPPPRPEFRPPDTFD